MSDHPSSVAPPPTEGAMIVLNPDGSYTRSIHFPSVPPTTDQNSGSLVLSKDVPVNPVKKTFVRIYLPKEAHNSTNQLNKLPLIVYYHGGGFVFISAATDIIHEFCDQMAAQLFAVVVSVEYRLAPEHRLPAAYEDAVEALHWIKSTQDSWLTNYADFSNCYLMGTSAGANIAYHAGVRVAAQINDLVPLKIKGLILHHIFFGGVKRTESEIRLADAGELTLSGCDTMWAFSLPIGADRDHVYSNPMAHHGSGDLERIKDAGWRVLVAGCYGDLLIDRQMELGKMLEEKDVKSVTYYGDGYHGIEIYDKSKAKDLFDEIRTFVSC